MATNEVNIGFHKEVQDTKIIFNWTLPVDILVTVNPYPLQQQVTTNCGHNWEFEISFQKEADTGIVSCFLTLKRDDKKDVTLNVKMHAFFTSKHSDYATVKTYNLEMLPRSEEKRSIHNILPSMKWRDDNQGMIIVVKVEIVW